MRSRLPMLVAAPLAALAVMAAPAMAATHPAHATAAGKHRAAKPVHYYLALGDSLSVGAQPDSKGVGRETAQGYTNDLYAFYKKRIPGLKLVELGCPGDTTTSMLTGKGNAAAAKLFHCDRKHGSQLKAAEAFLKAHHKRGEVSLVTVDIGANDVDGCSDPATAFSCAIAGVSRIAKNTPKILSGLRKAAPKGAALAGMNLYDPDLALELEPSNPAYALGSESLLLVKSINDTIAKADKAQRFKTADVASAFKTYDTAPTTVHGTRMPTDVAEICGLTWMCAPAPVGPNIHANKSGYGVIAKAFERVLGKL